MVNQKTLKQRIESLFREILLKCFDSNDEVDTRVGIYAEIRSKEKTRDMDEKAALKEVEKKFNNASFVELSVMYDSYTKENKNNSISYEPVEEENKMPNPQPIDKNAPLYNLVFNTRRVKDLSLYIEGNEACEYFKIKDFVFENKHYVLLKNKENKVEQYYYYSANKDDDDNLKERLVPIKDESLVRFFKDLGY